MTGSRRLVDSPCTCQLLVCLVLPSSTTLPRAVAAAPPQPPALASVLQLRMMDHCLRPALSSQMTSPGMRPWGMPKAEPCGTLGSLSAQTRVGPGERVQGHDMKVAA